MENEVINSEKTIEVVGKADTIIYGKGESCLLISPFDNLRLFTLYQNWLDNSGNAKTLSLEPSDSIFLVFKNNSGEEIRIPEYENTLYAVDRQNGQVLFKIEKEKSQKILKLRNKVFYITRKYSYIKNNEFVYSDDEEVLYTGEWIEEGVSNQSNLSTTIKTLNNRLQEYDSALSSLQESNALLIKQNAEYASSIVELQNTIEQLQKELKQSNENLMNSQGINGDELNGEIIDSYTTLINVSQADDELKNQLQQLTDYLNK